MAADAAAPDETTGDLILSRRPPNGNGLVTAIEAARSESSDFLAERQDAPAQPRELF